MLTNLAAFVIRIISLGSQPDVLLRQMLYLLAEVNCHHKVSLRSGG